MKPIVLYFCSLFINRDPAQNKNIPEYIGQQGRSQDFSKGGSHCVKVRVLT